MISTALGSRPCILTKPSLASTAAPAPSDVGLNTRTQKDVRTQKRIEAIKLCKPYTSYLPALKKCEEIKNLAGFNHLVQTILILELRIPERMCEEQE